MALSKDDARTAVEIGSFALGSLALTFPGVWAGANGLRNDAGGTRSLVRGLGARTIAYGALLAHAKEGSDYEEQLLLAGAAIASADCVGAMISGGKGKQQWPGVLFTLATSGTVAGLACWALAES
jgi:hypothetical protein